MNLITKSAKKTAPIAFGGNPNHQAMIAVVILAITRQVTALAKCLL
jgi:hypothetical protein